MKKQNKFKKRMNAGTKKVTFDKKTFVVLMVIFIIYQIGYGIGVLLSHFGL